MRIKRGGGKHYGKEKTTLPPHVLHDFVGSDAFEFSPGLAAYTPTAFFLLSRITFHRGPEPCLSKRDYTRRILTAEFEIFILTIHFSDDDSDSVARRGSLRRCA